VRFEAARVLKSALHFCQTCGSQYFFWLLIVSSICFLLERICPWRRSQRAFRAGFRQDLFWLIFNGHFAGIALAFVSVRLLESLGRVFHHLHLVAPESIHLLSIAPLWLQFIVFLVFKDFLEWCVHNLLHRVPWLWEFHKLHHSITELDFLGNFRFHWMETVVYKSLTYVPLVVLGVDGRVIFWIAIVGTIIGHLNHANLNIHLGPLRYVINSSRMHVWHHDLASMGGHGRNFGVVFSFWDFLFGTAYLPDGDLQPKELGFAGMERFPDGVPSRLLHPLSTAIRNRS
jgi:sterol desaturase/sphingolipid hydroxylase (fatty acid hydroxylase superfamily)